MSDNCNEFLILKLQHYMEHVLSKYTLCFNQINCAHLDLALGKILRKTTLSISLK